MSKTKIQGNPSSIITTEVQEQEREIYGYIVVKYEDRLKVAYMLVDHDHGIYLDATDQDISQHGGLDIVAPADHEVFDTREEAQEYIDEIEK
jgi:hypothetical protein